jgi:hypothetical protein
MTDRRGKDRLYTAILAVFLVGLVVLGLLGIPALLVGAIGLAAAAVGIAVFHRRLEAGARDAPRRRGAGQQVPQRYAPSVLEGSSMRRRRTVHLRRHRHATPPLRFR